MSTKTAYREVSRATKNAAAKMEVFYMNTEIDYGQEHYSIGIHSVPSVSDSGAPNSFVSLTVVDFVTDANGCQYLTIAEAERVVRELKKAIRQVRRLDEIEAANQ